MPKATAVEAADALGLAAEQVVLPSTGVIGVQMPIERVLTAVRDAASLLAADAGNDAARALTFRGPKEAHVAGDGFVRRRDGEGRGDDPSPARPQYSPSSRPTN